MITPNELRVYLKWVLESVRTDTANTAWREYLGE